MKTTNLKATSQKSFYGKAKLIEDNDSIKLKSYETVVAEYHKAIDKVVVFGWYSKTTMIHTTF